MRSTWAGHVDKLGDEKLAESRCPESGEIAMRDCIKNDIERVSEE